MSTAIDPSFSAWPKPKHNATLWLMANMILYVVIDRNKETAVEYSDYMRRARWKIYTWKKGKENFDMNLEVS
jgi:hypothetical protein